MTEESPQYIKATIKLRRGPRWVVQKHAEWMDGLTMFFIRGWYIEEDSSLYPNEVAYIPWPTDEERDKLASQKRLTGWVASGDLVDVIEVTSDDFFLSQGIE